MEAKALSPKLHKLPPELREWYSQCNSMSILVAGTSEARKQSSLINGLVGHNIMMALEGSSVDRGVQTHHFEHQDVKVTIWQSSQQNGFDKQDDYIADMQAQGCANADLVLYCVDMTQSSRNHHQFVKDIHDETRKLTKGLGKTIWNKAIFVATSANEVHTEIQGIQRPNPEAIRDYLKQCRAKLAVAVKAAVVDTGANEKIATNIPIHVAPAGSDQEQTLPDRDNWLSCLWCACILRMNVQSQPALLKINLHRINITYQKSKDLNTSIHEHPIIYIRPPAIVCSKPKIFLALEALAPAVHAFKLSRISTADGVMISGSVGGWAAGGAIAGAVISTPGAWTPIGALDLTLAFGGGGTDWLVAYYSSGCNLHHTTL